MWPNPATNNFNINFTAHKAGKVNVQMVDMSGRIVKSGWIIGNAGINQYNITDISGLSRGRYIVKLSGFALAANWLGSVIIQ
jgi:hypothetical protein